MFEVTSIHEDDPFADVVSGLSPEAEPPGYDPEFEAFLETLLAGDDTQAEVDVEAVLARGIARDAFVDHLVDETEVAGDCLGLKALVADLDDEALLTALQSAHRGISAAQARQAMMITELALRRAKDAVTELTGRKARGQEALGLAARALGEEVALELCLSKFSAGTLVDTCVGLCTESPDTLDALATGAIDWEKAAAIVGLVQTLVHAQECTNPDLDPEDQVDPDALGKALEEELLKKAGTEPVAGIRRAAARMMIEVNTRAAEHRHAIKKSHRQFWYSGDEDSMCRIGGYLPADAGLRVKHALTRLAYHARNLGGPADKRTLDQLRIDSLVETLTAAADNLHRQDKDQGTDTNNEGPSATAPPPSSDGDVNTDTVTRPDVDAGTNNDAGPSPNPNPNPNPSPSPSPSPSPDAGHNADTTASTSSDENADEGRIVDGDSPLDDELFTSDEGTDLEDLVENAPSTDTDTDTDTLNDSTGNENSMPRTKNSPPVQTDPHPPGSPNRPPTRATGPSSRPARRAGYGPGRGRSGSDPRVTITIAVSTLIGQDENPGFLHGYGPIVASMARDVAATGTWRCAITDDIHGTLMGLGTSTYTTKYKPTQALRRFLITRDRVCRVPGCNAPAEICDVDHCTPWPDGLTCECCTECLCGTHHRLKHETGFTLTASTNPNDPPGTLYWGTPAGHQYPSYPAQLDPHLPDPPKPSSAKPTDPGPGVPGSEPPGHDGPAPGAARAETSAPHTCSACTEADAEITADAAAARAFEEEQARARADAAARQRHTATIARNRRYVDPDYDDPYFWNDQGDQNRPATPEPYIPNPFYHRETLSPTGATSQGSPPASPDPAAAVANPADSAAPTDGSPAPTDGSPAPTSSPASSESPTPRPRTGPPRLRCSLTTLNPPPLTFDGPPPF